MSDSRITFLFYRYFDGTASHEDQQELTRLLSLEESREQIQTLMEEAWTTFSADQEVFSKEVSSKILTNVFDRPQGEISEVELERDDHIIAPNWWSQNWWSVAATVFITLGLSIYYFFGKNMQVPAQQQVVQNQQTEIRPGSNKATLTLGDGSIINLDQIQNGHISTYGDTKIEKPEDGQLIYKANKGDELAATFNTISVPRGGQYQIKLADGTQVWLNAASSLRYPTRFDGSERVVELTGEGYFEVAKHSRLTFKVKSNGSEIEVLGTNFNINAYSDEPSLKTTLLEGSVKISSGKESSLIKPGEEAVITSNEPVRIQKADLEKAIAWKNGSFQFSGTPLPEVMRQIMRWYDIDVTYEGKILPRQFGGEISRDSDLKDVLKILEISKIHFRLEGRKIVVLP
ncbi:FecR family protein [Dyadobacter sp. CY312]|uniref:FecR family protein n=1 Tax=Dyadobacter sp. CY312 TaxID=2907303 RepID=UPI001F3FBD94|nr:FecR family protein [Dyadobacter sp. CY312]MCE7040130.1 FecR domain-containing protein [Dyadobacter sp. CY312]